LKAIRDRIRQGRFLLADVEKLIGLPSEPNSFEYYSKWSLATEILEQNGDYLGAASFITSPGIATIASLRKDPIKSYNLSGLVDYKLHRQKLWCALAYCLSLYHQERFDEAVQHLKTIETQINEAIRQQAWPKDREPPLLALAVPPAPTPSANTLEVPKPQPPREIAVSLDNGYPGRLYVLDGRFELEAGPLRKLLVISGGAKVFKRDVQVNVSG
jgi:hypothetical protein